MGTFVNFSNHPLSGWNSEQIKAAEEYGEIVDLAFPSVEPDLSEEEVLLRAEESVEKILSLEPEIVLCQGEFTLAFAVVSKLLKRGIRVVAACSKRVVSEEKTDEGIKKTAVFVFARFREYKL